jgi:hypothetical protein
MLEPFAQVLCLLVISVLIFGCGDVDPVDVPLTGEELTIVAVLKKWRTGYENEDVDTYISTFWADGFLYTSDLGTDDKTDDVEFTDIREERESAIRVFSRYQDLEIELSEPPEIMFNEDKTRAEVKNHYRIQGFVADGESLEGGYTGWYAEGDSNFVFELRANPATKKKEWRITEWWDEAFSEEEIRAANKL